VLSSTRFYAEGVFKIEHATCPQLSGAVPIDPTGQSRHNVFVKGLNLNPYQTSYVPYI